MKTMILTFAFAGLAAAAHAAPAVSELQSLVPDAPPPAASAKAAPVAGPAAKPRTPHTTTAKIAIGSASCTISTTDDKRPVLRGTAGFVDSARSAGVLFIATEGSENVAAAKSVCEALKKVAGTGKYVQATVDERIVLLSVTIDAKTYSYTPVY